MALALGGQQDVRLALGAKAVGLAVVIENDREQITQARADQGCFPAPPPREKDKAAPLLLDQRPDAARSSFCKLHHRQPNIAQENHVVLGKILFSRAGRTEDNRARRRLPAPGEKAASLLPLPGRASARCEDSGIPSGEGINHKNLQLFRTYRDAEMLFVVILIASSFSTGSRRSMIVDLPGSRGRPNHRIG